MLWNDFIACFKIIYEIKKSFQFEIQELCVMKKIKCLILDILENCEKLNFIWQKRQKVHILLLFSMDAHGNYSSWSVSKIAWGRKNQ